MSNMGPFIESLSKRERIHLVGIAHYDLRKINIGFESILFLSAVDVYKAAVANQQCEICQSIAKKIAGKNAAKDNSSSV